MQNLHPVRIILFCALLCIVVGCITTLRGGNWLRISNGFPETDILEGVIIAEAVMGIIMYDLYIEYYVSIEQKDDGGSRMEDIQQTCQMAMNDIHIKVECDSDYVWMHMDSLDMSIDGDAITLRNIGNSWDIWLNRWAVKGATVDGLTLTLNRNDLDSLRRISNHNSSAGEYTIYAYYDLRKVAYDGEFLRLPDSVNECVCVVYQAGDSSLTRDTVYNVDCDEKLKPLDQNL